MQNNQSPSHYIYVNTFNNTGTLLPITNLQTVAPAATTNVSHTPASAAESDPTQFFVDKNTNTKYIIKEIGESNTFRNITDATPNTISSGSSSASSAEAVDKNTNNENDRIELGTFYFCEFCNASFSAKENIAKHIRFRNTGIYTCKLCCLIYCTKKLLFNHIFDVHPLYCNVCVSLYSSKDELDWHSLVHSKEEFKCRLCSKLCFNDIDLKLHIMQPKLRCNDCNDLFFCASTGLSKHQRIHKMGPPPLVNISSPIIATNTTSASTRTATTSTNTLSLDNVNISMPHPLTCNICMAKFANNQEFSIHEQRKFKCTSCSDKFCTKEDYEYHRETNHVTQKRMNKKPGTIPNKIPIAKKVLVFCQICRLQMAEERLEQHHANHTKCYICQKNYSFMYELNEHLANHTIEDLLKNKYECEFCTDNFPSFAYLQDHISAVHLNSRNCYDDIAYEDWRKDYEIQKLRISNNIHWEEANCIVAKVWEDIEIYRDANRTTWQKARLQYL